MNINTYIKNIKYWNDIDILIKRNYEDFKQILLKRQNVKEQLNNEKIPKNFSILPGPLHPPKSILHKFSKNF